MLSFEEFKDKRHIVLDKATDTYIMNRRVDDGKWNVIDIPRKHSIAAWSYHTYSNDDDAYEFFKERMASHSFKKFPVIWE